MRSNGSLRRSTGTLLRQVALFSGLLVIVPLLAYPRRLGFPPLDLAPAIGLLEWAFYVGVLSIATKQLPFATCVVAAGFTVVYRLTLGVLTGSLVSLAHSQPWSPTVAEMTWSYPLALIPHILTAPVVLSTLWEHLLISQHRGRSPRHAQMLGATTAPVRHRSPSVLSPAATASRVASGNGIKSLEPSFDSAVSYIGEYSGVRLCWVVDCEGLPVAVWQRQQYTGDADFWAPISVDMIEFHQRRLSTGGGACVPERIEVKTLQGRLVVESVCDFWLGVLTDPEADELVNVRISKAREMITRHLHDKNARTVVSEEASYV